VAPARNLCGGRHSAENDERCHTGIRQSTAAEAIFNHAAKAIEIEDIEARVAALEEAAGKTGQRP
jgi:hypothetical protein